MSLNSTTLIALGLIKKPRGLKGELLVSPYSASSQAFHPGLPVVVNAENSTVTTTVEHAKSLGHCLSVKLEGIDDRKAAEACAGGEIFCRFDTLPVKSANEYFVFDLVGLKVIDDAGEVFGEVRDVASLPANDALVVDSPQGEILVPFVKDFIRSISTRKGIVRISRIKEFLP